MKLYYILKTEFLALYFYNGRAFRKEFINECTELNRIYQIEKKMY